MKEMDDIISGFDSESLFRPDFTGAKLLNKTGSTCDAYECVIQRRRVFVKRLKGEYRQDPLYRAAFSKEYELGISLSHSSLPRYLACGEDYIVMDFIEGETLAEMIGRGDSRLQDKKFVKRLLAELIDVVEYLHNRNIVHCDIKPDNVIVSPYRDRPATLIDLDKAYTAWLDDTSGNPANYDCTGCADGDIDFRGIGKIASKLGFARVAAEAQGKNPTAESLSKALMAEGTRQKLWWVAAMICVATGIGAVIFLSVKDDKAIPSHSEAISQNHTAETKDNIALPDSLKIEPDKVMSVNFEESDGDKEGKNKAKDGKVKDSEPVAAPAVENNAAAAVVSSKQENTSIPDDGVREMDEFVRQEFAPLFKRQIYLTKLAGNKAEKAAFLQRRIRTYADDYDKAYRKAIHKTMEIYGLSNSFEAVGIFLGQCNEWARFMKEDLKLRKLYEEEIKWRLARGDSISR